MPPEITNMQQPHHDGQCLGLAPQSMQAPAITNMQQPHHDGQCLGLAQQSMRAPTITNIQQPHHDGQCVGLAQQSMRASVSLPMNQNEMPILPTLLNQGSRFRTSGPIKGCRSSVPMNQNVVPTMIPCT